ncbi:hypothetical protein SPBRAN_1147 [uncultured Candidatus Thioglobus sp.]|nr:hypothetical protein SPBRAN_1147 [uncultured Candidatus Thioglobus sp.]
MAEKRWKSGAGKEVEPYKFVSPSSSRDASRSVTPLPQISKSIPPPPFSMPPKLRTIEEVMANYTGSDAASLRKLTTALARESIFGRDELAKKSLTGRKDTEQLDRQKVNYIKTLVQSRVPNKSDVDFEVIWKWCRGSLSKCCQTLRNTEKKKVLTKTIINQLILPLSSIPFIIFHQLSDSSIIIYSSIN